MPGSKDNLLIIKDGVLVSCYQGVAGSINIPPSVTRIGENAFFGCSGLTSCKIPEGVTSIGEEAFWSCSNLKAASITINMIYMKLREYIGLGSHLLIDRVNRSGNAYKFISGLGLEVKFNLMVRGASTKLIDRFVNPELRE